MRTTEFIPHLNPFSAISVASCSNLLYRNTDVIVEQTLTLQNGCPQGNRMNADEVIESQVLTTPTQTGSTIAETAPAFLRPCDFALRISSAVLSTRKIN